MVSFSYINLVGFVLFFASTGLTVCYSFRLFYYGTAKGGHAEENCLFRIFGRIAKI
jgi:hypothetical protein